MAWCYGQRGIAVWIPDNITTATTTTGPTVYRWIIPSGTSATTTTTWYANRQPRHDDDAVQRALFARERQRQAIMFAGHAEAASAVADGLLMEHLTPEQRECFKQNKWFVVEGGKSKQKYRICAKDNLIANVDVLEGDSIRHRLCAHADPKAMPLGDHLLAQKMMIEFAEDNFLRVANRHAYHGHA